MLWLATYYWCHATSVVIGHLLLMPHNVLCDWPPTCNATQRLLWLATYFWCHITYDVIGHLFLMPHNVCCDWAPILMPHNVCCDRPPTLDATFYLMWLVTYFWYHITYDVIGHLLLMPHTVCCDWLPSTDTNNICCDSATCLEHMHILARKWILIHISLN